MERNTVSKDVGYITEKERTLPVRGEYDVLVAGGGTAGCAAAICAARAGARVVIVEALPFLGGTLGAGGIGINNVSSSWVSDRIPVRRVVKGFTEEFVERLRKQKGAGMPTLQDPKKDPFRQKEKAYFDHEVPRPLLAEMALEAGADVLLHTWLSDVVTEDGTVKYVITESKSGREAIAAKCFIDSTGDGDLAVKAGAGWMDVHKNYKGRAGASNTGFVFGIGEADIAWLQERAKECNAAVFSLVPERSVTESEKASFWNIRIQLSKIPELWDAFEKIGISYFNFYFNRKKDLTYALNINIDNVDVTDTKAYSAAEMEVRIRALHMVNTLREKVPGFENCYMSWQAPILGVRASRIIRCDYSVTEEDILTSKRFPDEVGVFGYHDQAPVDSKWTMSGNGAYGLPYRMLLPVGLKNVWAAGRMVSEEPGAHMSTRNTVCCMQQGQAAGVAAALCAEKECGSRDLSYDDLKKKLLEQNVYLGR